MKIIQKGKCNFMNKSYDLKENHYKSQSCEHAGTNCMNCRLKQDSLFSHLSLNDLAILNQNRYSLSFKAGEILCKTGIKPPGLLCLTSGKVKITRAGQNGEEQIVAFKKPSDFIAFRSVMLDAQSPVSAIALEDCTVCVIDKKDLYTVVQNNSGLAFKFIRYFANESKNMETRLICLTQKHMRSRLADALLHLINTFSFKPDQKTIDVALKRTELAGLSNMSTANAIRFLSAFSKEKLIKIDRRQIKVLNLKALKDISLSGW